MRGSFRDQALESRFVTEEMTVRELRPDMPIQLPDALRTEALVLRNRLLHFRLTQRFKFKSDPERVIVGVDPRLNQTALSLLSLVDDAVLREEIAMSMREKQAQFAAVRARESPARTIAILKEASRQPGRRAVSLRELADRLNAANGDFVDASVTPRQVGQMLRDLGIPVQKSHGTMVVPMQALAALDERRAS